MIEHQITYNSSLFEGSCVRSPMNRTQCLDVESWPWHHLPRRPWQSRDLLLLKMNVLHPYFYYHFNLCLFLILFSTFALAVFADTLASFVRLGGIRNVFQSCLFANFEIIPIPLIIWIFATAWSGASPCLVPTHTAY